MVFVIDSIAIWKEIDKIKNAGRKAPITKSELPRESSDLERKKETADVELSRHLRKPGKRNGAGFF